MNQLIIISNFISAISFSDKFYCKNFIGRYFSVIYTCTNYIV